MNAVQVIAPTRTMVSRKNERASKILRVAAYCRVSTDSEEQLTSYNSQMAHYTNMIENKPEWEMANIYADFGISGTQTKKRTEFLRMISDAENGLIDLIITKSVSRFARNTIDTLKYVRQLKEKGVAVFFEKENIQTLTQNGEMLLTILSSLAQAESESISQNTKMGLKMIAKQGGLIGFNACLGYDYDKETKSIFINEEGAKIVQFIFERYVEGIGCNRIAKELTAKGIPTPTGKTNWADTVVAKMIRNAKYVGDLVTGKTYTVDPISKKRLVNLGEEEMYYMENHHEGIISRELFNKAQEIREKRSSRTNGGRIQTHTMNYPFSSIMKCGFCGGTYIRRTRKPKSGDVNFWLCNCSVKNGKASCPYSKGIDESIIENGFIRAFNRLCNQNKAIIDDFLENISKSIEYKEYKNELKKLNEKMNTLQNKKNKLIDLLLDEKISKTEYDKRFGGLNLQITELQSEMEEVEKSSNIGMSLEERLKTFKKIFDAKEPMEKFDGEVFRLLIKKVVIGGLDKDGKPLSYMVNFIFNTGLEVNISPLFSMPNTHEEPHAPWQRGTNENTNGLLRQFYPKGTSLACVTKEQLDYVVSLINNRPRKRLGWRTPTEVFNSITVICCT